MATIDLMDRFGNLGSGGIKNNGALDADITFSPALRTMRTDFIQVKAGDSIVYKNMNGMSSIWNILSFYTGDAQGFYVSGIAGQTTPQSGVWTAQQNGYVRLFGSFPAGDNISVMMTDLAPDVEDYLAKYDAMNYRFLPNSIPKIVAHIQEYLSNHPIADSTTLQAVIDAAFQSYMEEIQQTADTYIAEAVPPAAAAAVDAAASPALQEITAKAAEAAESARQAGLSQQSAEMSEENALTYRNQAQQIKESITAEVAASVQAAQEQATLAQESAQAADQSADTAEQFVAQARAQAEAAADHAQTASGYASDAQGYMQDASGFAQNASDFADNAAQSAATFSTDPTLTISGKAADAKATGDELSDLKSALDEIEGAINYIPQTIQLNQSINTNTGKPILPSNIRNEQNWCCVCVPCAPRDEFVVTGTGGSSARLWAFSSSDGAMIVQAYSGETGTELHVIAPQNAAYFAYNSRMAVDHDVYKGSKPKEKIENINSDLLNVYEEITKLNAIQYEATTAQYTGRVLANQGWVASDVNYDTSTAISVDGAEFVACNYSIDLSADVKFAMIFYGTQTLGTDVKGYIKKIVENKPIKVPSGSKYVRISYPTSETKGLIKLKNKLVTADNEYVITAKQATLSDGESLIACSNIDNKKNDCITFYADIDSRTFNSVSVGHGYNIAYGAYIVVDDTNITLYYGASQYGEPKPHGLTIDKFVFVEIRHTNNARAEIQLYSASGSFKLDSSIVPWGGCKGDVFATSNNSSLSNCTLSITFRDWLTDIFVFGDSYLGLESNERWPHYLIEDGYTKVCLNGFGGATVQEEMVTFRNVIDKARPKYAVFALGMNNTDNSDSINSDYKAGIDEFIETCITNNVIPILSTIPNVPSRNNTFKNTYVKSLGYRYIDFAKAVGAEASGSTWYLGMLSSDNVHPTQLGAKALYARVLSDFPEVMK